MALVPPLDDDADYVPEPPEELVHAAPEWAEWVTTTAKGHVQPTGPNATIILCHDPAWRGVLGTNLLQQREEWRLDRPGVEGWPLVTAGTEVADGHEQAVQHWLARHVGGTWGREAVNTAIREAARAQPYDPSGDWLRGLTWDGVPRVGDWVIRYLGCEPVPLTATVGRWWLQQAAARVLDPGCQADYVLVLEGPQGARKTSALRALAGQWYREITLDLSNRAEAARGLRGCVIGELAELASLRRTSHLEAVKAWITAREDRWTPKYLERDVAWPRRCVFAATTNAREYLSDPTGARRWWPVLCGSIDLEALERDRDQLWAEAAHLHASGERRWPTDGECTDLETVARDRSESDPWELVLRTEMEQRGELSLGDCLAKLDIDPGDQTPSHAARVRALAQAFGWERVKNPVHRAGQRVRVWRAGAAVTQNTAPCVSPVSETVPGQVWDEQEEIPF